MMVEWFKSVYVLRGTIMSEVSPEPENEEEFRERVRAIIEADRDILDDLE